MSDAPPTEMCTVADRLRRLETLIGILPVRILVVDRTGAIRDDIGGEDSERTCAHVHELVPPEKRDLCDRYLRTVFDTGQQAICAFREPAGGKRMEALVQPIEPDRVVVVLRDQSARDRMERELREAVIQRDRWRREVHAQGLADMRMISSLVYLDGMAAAGDSRRLVNRVQRRIRSLALVHESVVESVDRLRVDFGHYLRLLVGRLPSGMSSPSLERPLVHAECQGVLLPMDIAVALGLVVDELVQNAFAHAFPADHGTPPGGPQIWVSVTESPTALHISVRDNGAGLAPGIDPERPASLGLRLVRTLTEQVGGHLYVDAPSPATLRVEVPLPEDG